MIWTLVTISSLGAVAFAAENESTASAGLSNRMNNKLGAFVGIVGDPYPSILGVNVGYNVTDFMRASLGYGSIEVTTGMSVNGSSVATTSTKVTSVGAGLTGFMPGWNLSPTAGLHITNVSTEGDGEIEVQGFQGNGTLLYGSLGLDWQAGSGFNLAAGYNVPFGKGAGGLYASAGWFFDVLN